jgi:L-alanine-DL-glutamate epimerase-like enolase superfamily enzyme
MRPNDLFHSDERSVSMSPEKSRVNRRTFFTRMTKATAAVAAGSLVTNADLEEVGAQVNKNSSPSDLKITDMRVCPFQSRYLIRIDTNQGLSGYGEIRDGSSPTFALMLKSRILGMNPCNVEQIFRKIKQFGTPARGAAGPVSVEEACWDLTGKAWGVPVWQMLGGKYRDGIRLYADTPSVNDPAEMGKRLKGRIDMGFTFLKMDISINLCRNIPGTLTYPQGGPVDPFDQYGNNRGAYTPHPFTGIRVTDKGLQVMADYVAGIRAVVGWDIPLATDHYGHFMVEDAIKFARKMDQFNLAWYEDLVPWEYTEHLKRIKESCTTPVLTGEDIYLLDGFKDLIDKDAVSMIHPDLASAGGILETKKIGDYAQQHGIAMAMHMAGNAVTLFSSVHTAAATENFMVMEHHNPDDAWYNDQVTNVPKPLMQKGFVPVPNGPGLGIELNLDLIRKSLRNPDADFFAPTDQWNREQSWDRTWSGLPPVANGRMNG